MAGNHNEEVKPHILERLEEVAELYLAGYSQRKIALKVDVSQSQVWNDLQEIRKQWKESAVQDYSEKIALECQRLDAIEREAWEGWRRSQEDEVTTEDRVGGNDASSGGFTVTSTKTKGQAGAAAFLTTAMNCVKARCELLGLNAPQKYEDTGDKKLVVVVDEDFFGNAARFDAGTDTEADVASVDDPGSSGST